MSLAVREGSVTAGWEETAMAHRGWAAKVKEARGLAAMGSVVMGLEARVREAQGSAELGLEAPHLVGPGLAEMGWLVLGLEALGWLGTGWEVPATAELGWAEAGPAVMASWAAADWVGMVTAVTGSAVPGWAAGARQTPSRAVMVPEETEWQAEATPAMGLQPTGAMASWSWEGVASAETGKEAPGSVVVARAEAARASAPSG